MLRPHLLGVDDGPFDKRRDATAPLVGVLTEGADLVEAVAVTRFAVDGDGAAEFLAAWVGGLRCATALHGVVLGGLTIAGLGVVDVELLARRLAVPVLVVNRRDPRNERLEAALVAAGLAERIPLVRRAPGAVRAGAGLWVAAAGTDAATALRLIAATVGKARVPEPLRLAHLVAAALVRGESRGRV